MTLQECVSYLTENGYLIHVGTRYLLTSKFGQELTGQDFGVSVVEPERLVVKERIVSPKKPVTLTGGEIKGTDQVDWAGLYQQLIMDSKIPKLAFNNNGNEYEIRKR